jgi:hypothetical protein
VVAAVVVFAVAAVMTNRWRGGPGPNEKKGGCEQDLDCGAGRVCARGGCLPLIGGEDARAWRAELDAQLAPQSTWRPRPAYGDKWVFADVCPVPAGAAEPLEEAKVALVSQTRVYEIRPDRLRVHLRKREKGARWLEAMRFQFPAVAAVDLKRACASPEVSNAEIRPGRPAALEVQLRQTVPAGAIAAATVSIEADLPAAGRDGTRTLKIPLEPIAGDAVAFTLVALPLGTHVAQMGGPSPLRQRLLPGFAVYYWRHALQPGTVAIVFDARRAPATAELPLGEIKS